MREAVGERTPAERERANRILTPYVPRLVVDWLRETPDAAYREIEGSLAFVDISGFTALTERLARKGKVGAELMRDTLDVVFCALLDEAYDYGAGLLKWGGDAVLLLFDGPGHEARACRAAWEMQRVLGVVGRLKAAGGGVTLRMSVGITTGTYQFFMAGTVHRELLVAGPAVTEMLEIESIADAGEIGISERLAARLEPACRGPRKEQAILLAAAPDVGRERAPDVGDVRGIDIAACIPVAAREHVLLERSEPEHRTITAAFIDMVGTDELLAEVGPDRLAEGLHERLAQIQEAALRYEVPFYETDVGKSSVKALLTAGAPSSTGADEERMLRALREVMEKPGLVPLRIGVNTGKVFTGDFGPPYRRAYRVFGDAINTAARVMSKAEPGQVLATETVLERSRTLFRTTPIEPFAAKGKALPVHASIVGPVAGTRGEVQRGAASVGREPELGELLAAIDGARRGEGWIVEVVAQTGLGQASLVDAALAQAADLAVFRARCEEYESGTPYFPLRAPFRRLVGAEPDADADEVEARLRETVASAAPQLEAWLPVVAIPFGLDLEPTPETAALDERFLRERLAELTTELLTAALGDAPALLAVEEAHHLDEATADLLARLGRTARAAGGRRWVLVVIHAGPGALLASWEHDEDARILALTLLPLPPAGIEAVAELATESDPLPSHVLSEIARRSGGNPLFLFELLDAYRATGSLEALPDSVEAIAAGEIDRLSAADRTVLRTAAVLGTVFDPELLAAAVAEEGGLEPEVWSRLGALVRRTGGDRLRFRNAVVRDAAYEGLPYRRRRILHERVGEAIEARAGDEVADEIGVLALHFHEAQRWDKAWHYSRLAGERAMQVYANVDAERAFERAVTAGRRVRRTPPAELAAAHESLGDVRLRLGEFDEAGRSFARARSLVRDRPDHLARLLQKQARIPFRQGEYGATLRRVDRSLRDLDGLDGRVVAAERSRLLSLAALVRHRQNRNTQAVELCSRAALEARAARDDEALAHAYLIHDISLWGLGRRSSRYARDALGLFERVGALDFQAGVLVNMGLRAHDRGDWNECAALNERARQIWQSTGNQWSMAFAMANIGEVLSDQGHWDEAEPMLRTPLRILRSAGATADRCYVQRLVGRLAARRGDHDEAARLLEDAAAAARAIDDHAEAIAADAYRAEALLLAGRAEPALALARASAASPEIDAGEAALVALLQRVAGTASFLLGDASEAERSLRAALSTARARKVVYETGLALDALARTAPPGRRSAIERRRDEILDRLGVVRLAVPPER